MLTVPILAYLYFLRHITPQLVKPLQPVPLVCLVVLPQALVNTGKWCKRNTAGQMLPLGEGTAKGLPTPFRWPRAFDPQPQPLTVGAGNFCRNA